ncbi:MAG: AI-2E family transporter [Burkholderiaceae bacterium]|jgi:predicted PurR-regulated permease PerM|nr:AI-2E family transporter [Burkholderiaceae bacterium]
MLLTPPLKNALIWLGIGVALLWLIWLLGSILMPFLVGITLAYVLHPLVERLKNHRIPRALGAALAITVAIGLFVGLFLLLVPVIGQIVPLIREKFPLLLQTIYNWSTPLLARFDIHLQFSPASVQQTLSKYLTAHGEDWAGLVLRSASTGGIGLLVLLGNLTLIPVVAFYLLLDWGQTLTRLSALIPPRHRDAVLHFFHDCDIILGQYLRGQLLVMLILAFYYSAGLAIAGFNLALPVGIFTGLAVFVPYVGFGLGLLLALTTGALQFLSWYGVIAVAIVYGVGQLIESLYITPKFVGESIGLHPLLVIFILLAFGTLFGFWGILLALPAGALLLVVTRRLLAWYRQSALFV